VVSETWKRMWIACWPITPSRMHFLQDLVEDVLNAKDMNFDKPRNRNSTWDLKLAFHASVGARLAGVPVLLVSADGRIHRAASRRRLPHRSRGWRIVPHSSLTQDRGTRPAPAEASTRHRQWAVATGAPMISISPLGEPGTQ